MLSFSVRYTSLCSLLWIRVYVLFKGYGYMFSFRDTPDYMFSFRDTPGYMFPFRDTGICFPFTDTICSLLRIRVCVLL